MNIGIALRAVVFSILLTGVSLTAAPQEAGQDEWVGQFAPLLLESEDKAVEFAKNFIANIQFEGKPNAKVIEVLHIEGQTLSPYLETMLTVLSQAGYEVQGTFVSKRELEDAAREVDSTVVRYNLDSHVDHRGILNRIFGLPQGVTFLSHFLNGKQWKYKSDSQVFKFARNTTGLAAVTMVAMRYLIPFMSGMLNSTFGLELPVVSPQPMEMAATTTLISSWIFHFLQFRREWSSVRTQARGVVVDPAAAPNEQIKVAPNSKFFAASCIAQEHLLSGLVLSVLYHFGVVDPQTIMEGIMTVAGASFVSTASALSYIKFEEVMAARLLEAEKLSQSNDRQGAENLRKQVGFLSNIFYNVLFPVASYTGRFMQGVVGGVPLMVLGGGSWWWANKQTAAKTRPFGDGPRPLAVPSGGTSCAAVLRFR